MLTIIPHTRVLRAQLAESCVWKLTRGTPAGAAGR